MSKAVSRVCVAPALALAAMPGGALAGVAADGAYRGNEVISLGGLLQMATGLVLVLLLIFGAAWFAKRFGRFQGVATDRLRLMGGVHLGNRERIILVQAEDVRLVVGVSPGCIRTLHVLPAGDGPGKETQTHEAADGEGFLGRLNQEFSKRIRT
jgi:flagellar protein FliO/FliZ